MELEHPAAAGVVRQGSCMRVSVANYLLDRLARLGVREVFGVPGDYSFPLVDAVVARSDMRWVGAANELGAAYMADGSARVSGISALCTTFGVGELGALPGVAGSFAERVPVVHIVGLPPSRVLAKGLLVHHAMGETDLGVFSRMSAEASCAHAVLTASDAKREIDRVISFVRDYSLPAYLGVPADVAEAIVEVPCEVERAAGPELAFDAGLGEWSQLLSPHAPSDPAALREATKSISDRLRAATNPCALVGAIVPRLGLRSEAVTFLELANLPFLTMWMDKSALPESHPLFAGMYAGAWGSPEAREFVEGCDLVINAGALMTDLNTAAYTARLDPSRVVTMRPSSVSIGAAEYHGVRLGDLLRELATSRDGATMRGAGRDRLPQLARGTGPVAGSGTGEIDAAAFFPRCERFLRADDLLFVESGTVTMGLLPALMPEGAEFMSQSQWAAIGWAAPAAIGASLTRRTRRVVCVTGEGALQCTAQELGTAANHGARPVIIVINNDGYLTERLLCRDPDAIYNDVPKWDYLALARSLGCGAWWIGRATTCDELDRALAEITQATQGASARGAFLEVVMPRMALPAMAAAVRAGRPGR